MIKTIYVLAFLLCSSCNLLSETLVDDVDANDAGIDFGKTKKDDGVKEESALELCGEYQYHMYTECFPQVCNAETNPLPKIVREEISEYESAKSCAEVLDANVELKIKFKNIIKSDCSQLKNEFCRLSFGSVCNCNISVGEGCKKDQDCIFGESGGLCFKEAKEVPGGYCASLCPKEEGKVYPAKECGSKGLCWNSDSFPVPFCGLKCEKQSDCRTGYECSITQEPSVKNNWTLLRLCDPIVVKDCSQNARVCKNRPCVGGECIERILWKCDGTDRGGGFTSTTLCTHVGGTCSKDTPSFCVLP